MLHTVFEVIAVVAAFIVYNSASIAVLAVSTRALVFALMLIVGYYAAAVLWVVLIFILSCFVNKKKPAGKHWRFYRRILVLTAGFILRFLRVRVHVSGLEKMPKDGRRYLFTCNHRDIYDPMVSMMTLKDYDMTFISKKENFDILMVGRLMHGANVLSIDRENDRSAVRTIVQAIKLLKEDEVSIALYPEGYCRRSRDVRLQPFRDGSLKIAQKAKVPVVVSTIRGTDDIMPNFKRFGSTDVYFDILSVLESETFAEQTTHELGEEIWKIMDQNLAKGECV